MKETEHNDSQELGASDHAVMKNANPTQANQPRLKCSYCGTVFFKNESRAVPFCSKRCQQIDLGMWLNESYGLPIESSDNEFVQDDDSDVD